MIVRIRPLVRRHVFTTGDEQALGVDKPTLFACLFLRNSEFTKCGHKYVGDANASLAGAKEQYFLLAEFPVGDPQCANDPGNCHRARTLYVVVEQASLVAILLKQPERVNVAEVLELDKYARECFVCGRYKFFDQVIVLLAPNPPAFQAVVQWVIEQGLVVGANIQHDGHAMRWVYARAGGIKRELSDRNAHAIGAEIAEPEYAFTVGHDNDLDILVRPISQQFPNLAMVIQRDIKTTRITIDVLKFLACLAHRRCVDNGHHLFDVVHYYAVEQRFVSILQRYQVQIAFEIRGFLADIPEHPQFLFRLGVNPRWQQSPQFQVLSLCMSEGGTFIANVIVENLNARVQCRWCLVVHGRISFISAFRKRQATTENRNFLCWIPRS